MSVICPKDMLFCPDDLCNGGGSCVRTGETPLEQCAGCRNIVDPDLDGAYCDDCRERDEIENADDDCIVFSREGEVLAGPLDLVEPTKDGLELQLKTKNPAGQEKPDA